METRMSTYLSPPATVADIDDTWLTEALVAAGALPRRSRARVAASTELGDGSGWMCEVAQLDLDFSGDPGSMPRSVVIKIPVDDAGVREMLASARLYEREGRFFQHAAHQLDDRVPAAHLVIEEPAEGIHVLLIENLEGGRFGDQQAGCSAADAENALRTMAALHARFWESPQLVDFDWLPAINFEGNSMGSDLYRMSIDTFRNKFEYLLDPANALITDTIADHGRRLLDLLAEPPNTLIHFDFRLDNLYFPAAVGPDAAALPVRMIDFQTVSRANPGYDLGYFLTQSLDTEVRRDHEEDLLGIYVEELAAGGVRGYTLEDAHFHYRCGALYAWITPVFVMANLDMSNPRALDMWKTVVRRCQAAQIDLDLAELIT